VVRVPKFCAQCHAEMTQKNARKFCGKECSDLWWNEQRTVGETWGEYSNRRYGVLPDVFPASTTDLAWLAGIIDGEGTISIYKEQRPANKSGYRYYSVVEISNSNEGIINRLSAILPDSAVKMRANKPKPNHKQVWKLKITRRWTKPVLTTILPYLVGKRKQAEVVLAFQRAVEAAPRRTGGVTEVFEGYKQQITKLNKRGI